MLTLAASDRFLVRRAGRRACLRDSKSILTQSSLSRSLEEYEYVSNVSELILCIYKEPKPTARCSNRPHTNTQIEPSWSSQNWPLQIFGLLNFGTNAKSSCQQRGISCQRSDRGCLQCKLWRALVKVALQTLSGFAVWTVCLLQDPSL